MSNLILGIDPGFSGGVCWLNVDSGKIAAVVPMPTKKSGKGLISETRTTIDVERLNTLIFTLSSETLFAVIEKVSSSPQMGVTSAFRFGEGFGIIQGVLAANGVKMRFVYPNVWKTDMNLSSDKTKSTDKACKLFPNHTDVFLAAKKSADLAESALIAYYGRKFLIDKTCGAI